jgi:hypothetical protein
MGVTVELSVPPEAFPLGGELIERRGIGASLEPIVPIENGSMPYLWLHGVEEREVEDALAGAETVDLVEENDDDVLVRVSWTTDDYPFLEAVRTADGAIMSARTESRDWILRIRFRDHSRVSQFKHECDVHGVEVTLRSIDHRLTDDIVDSPLTQAQRETLELAVEKGYFDIPRRATLSELADELGVSDQATSERIRRGIHAMLSHRLQTDLPEAVGR